MTDKEKKAIKSLVINTVLNKFDPGEHGGMSYSIHRWITIYVDCLRVARHLNIDLIKYRKKIINFIPFAFDNDLDFIFDL